MYRGEPRYAESISITQNERDALLKLYRTSGIEDHLKNRIRILLDSDSGLGKGTLASMLQINESTVQKVRSRYRTGGILYALFGKDKMGAPHKLTEQDKLTISSLIESPPPEGCRRWTIQLLYDKITNEKLTSKQISRSTLGSYLQSQKVKRGGDLLEI